MLSFDFDDTEVKEIAREFSATPKQLEMAERRALKRTAATLRKLSTGGLKSELGLRTTRELRRRIKEYRVGRGGSALKLWYGANDLPWSAFKGRPRQVPGGVQFGNDMIHGAFLARIGGRRGVYRRETSRAFPVKEVQREISDRVMIYLEDEVFVDIDAIYFKHLRSEVRARTILGVGGEYG